MRNKKLWIALGLSIVTIIGLIGCTPEKESSAVVSSEAVDIGLNAKEAIDREASSSSEETASDIVDDQDSLIEEASSGGTDSPTDEEVEAEIEEQQQEQESSGDSDWGYTDEERQELIESLGDSVMTPEELEEFLDW